MAQRLDRIVIVAADPVRGRAAGMAVQHLLEVSPGRDVEIGPVPLSNVELGTYAQQWNASLVAERDQLIAERDQLQTDNADIAAQLVSRTAERDALAAELDALRNPPGPDLATTEGVKAFISSRRYAREVGGIWMQGQSISTARDETGHWFPRFYDAMLWLSGDPAVRGINPEGVYPYKPKNGEPVILTAGQVMRAYQCMAWYINACFASEKQLYALLDARIPLADVVMATDADESWPQNQFKWEPPQ